MAGASAPAPAPPALWATSLHLSRAGRRRLQPALHCRPAAHRPCPWHQAHPCPRARPAGVWGRPRQPGRPLPRLQVGGMASRQAGTVVKAWRTMLGAVEPALNQAQGAAIQRSLLVVSGPGAATGPTQGGVPPPLSPPVARSTVQGHRWRCARRDRFLHHLLQRPVEAAGARPRDGCPPHLRRPPAGRGQVGSACCSASSPAPCA